MENPWDATSQFWNQILGCSKNCVIASHTAANQATKIVKVDTKLYVVVVTLSTKNNAKLLQQSKWGFTELIGINLN